MSSIFSTSFYYMLFQLDLCVVDFLYSSLVLYIFISLCLVLNNFGLNCLNVYMSKKVSGSVSFRFSFSFIRCSVFLSMYSFNSIWFQLFVLKYLWEYWEWKLTFYKFKHCFVHQLCFIWKGPNLLVFFLWGGSGSNLCQEYIIYSSSIMLNAQCSNDSHNEVHFSIEWVFILNIS